VRLKQVVTLFVFLFGLQIIPVHGQVVATWTDASGNWSNAPSWSSNPSVPNNVGGATYDVVINGTGSDTVTFDANGTVINSLTMGAGEILQDSGHAPTLTIAGPAPEGIVLSGTINWGNGANLVIGSSGGPYGPYGIGVEGTLNFTNRASLVLDMTGGNQSLGAALNFNNASITVVDGSGDHTLRITAGGSGTSLTLVDSTVAVLGGNLDLIKSVDSLNNSNLTVNGGLTAASNLLSLSGSAMNVRGDFFDGDAEVHLSNRSVGIVGGNFHFDQGSFSLDASSLQVGGDFSGGPHGTTTIQNGSFLSVAGNFLNDQFGPTPVNITGGSSANVAGTFTNGGLVSIVDGSLNVRGNLANTTSTGGLGNVVLQNGGVLSVGGAFTNEVSGNLSPNTLQLIGAGNLASFHAIQNNGLIQVDHGSVMTINGGGFNNNANGSLTLGGDLNTTGGFNNSGGSVIVSPTATLVADRYSQSAGSTDISGALFTGGYSQTGGITTIESGGLMKATTFTAMGGTVTVNGILDPAAVEFGSGATLQGSGTIIGNVAMGGTMSNSGDTLTIFGNYEQVGSGTLEALISPTSRALLDIHGDAALGGGSLLDLMLADGYDPLGQTFVIMQYASLVGQFSNGSSFCEDGYLWDITYGTNQIDVTAVATPEPGTLGLLVVGLISLILLSCRGWSGVVRSLGAAQ